MAPRTAAAILEAALGETLDALLQERDGSRIFPDHRSPLAGRTRVGGAGNFPRVAPAKRW